MQELQERHKANNAQEDAQEIRLNAIYPSSQLLFQRFAPCFA